MILRGFIQYQITHLVVKNLSHSGAVVDLVIVGKPRAASCFDESASIN